MRWFALLVAAAVVFGCDKTQECERLEAMVERAELVATNVRKKAAVHDRVAKKAEEVKKDAQAFLDSLGLDDPEEKTKKILDDRVAAIAGATVKRNVRSPDPASTSMRPEQTYWTVQYSADTTADAVEIMKQLAKSPPLFVIKRLNRDPGNAKRWQLELVRALVDRVPIKPKPVLVAALPDPSTVKSEFGFCGAGALRSKLSDLKSEVESLKEKAEQLTILMPMQASWSGLERRARWLHDAEVESRRIIHLLASAAIAAKVSFVGIGVLDPDVILEVKGGAPETRRLEAQFAEHAREIKWARSKKGTVRMQMSNREFRDGTKKEPGPGGGRRHPGDHRGHGAH